MKIRTLLNRVDKAKQLLIDSLLTFVGFKVIKFHINDNDYYSRYRFIPVSIQSYYEEGTNKCYLKYRNADEYAEDSDAIYEDSLDEFSMDELAFIIECLEVEYKWGYIEG